MPDCRYADHSCSCLHINMYLFQFARETINVFELVVKLWEIAYQLQKIRMILDLKEDWNYGNPYKILSMV